MLLLAVPLHMGIAICLGMVTFGLIMLVGNLAFVPPSLVRALFCGRGQGRGAQAAALGAANSRSMRSRASSANR
jgi:hypothetical protein